MQYLDFNTLPIYLFSDKRQFLAEEKHVRRTPNFHVLILMFKGVLRFHENGIPVELHPGEYYIQPAGLFQEGRVPSDIPNYFFIHFHGNLTDTGNLPLRGQFDVSSILKLTDELHNLGLNATKMEYQRCFFAILSALYNEEHTDTDAEKLKNYLIEHFAEDITSKTLKTLVFCSKNQMINVFKAQYQTTPYQYLIQYRLNKACELLLSTERTIKEIALSVGFHEYTAFFKLFRSKYGVSPQEFRKLSDKAYYSPNIGIQK